MKQLFCVLILMFFVGSPLCVANESKEQEPYRLSKLITPEFQSITLVLDPDEVVFRGDTDIQIVVSNTVEHVEFYQSSLSIEKAVLLKRVHGEELEEAQTLTVSPAKYDIQHAKGSKLIEPGSYTLRIMFSGKLNSTSDGAYRSTFEGLNYISTQFEDMHARKAFPSFDEPDNKIPYQITIRAPEKHVVLSNTVVEQRVVEQGWQTVRFKKTKPMPTYLIAFAVGEFDSAEITGLSVPGRIYTPKGQSGRTKFAIKNTPKILKHLEAYFGIPYPYEKLDFVAVPNFTHGAMENVGLVTFRSGLLLMEDEPRLSDQARPLTVIAHELAHMWYGNLVTMTWWDDLWLNEAFASWMASKVMMDLYPEHNFAQKLVAERAFPTDAAPTTRPVKKKVRTSADVFDGLGLNYTKGEAILQLAESILGPDAFQSAVKQYMNKHAFGNAKAKDLWEAMAGAGNKHIPSIMRSLLTQPSYPLVTLHEDGKIEQQRYRLIGAKVKAQNWVVPLSLLVSKDGVVENVNVLVDQSEMHVSDIEGADWVFPNKDARGYLRWQISSKQLSKLLDDLDVLNVRERKSLLSNSQALLDSGKIGFTQHMTVLNALAKDKDKRVAQSVANAVYGLTYLVNDSNRAMFGAFVERYFGAWLARLGTIDRADDSDEVNRLRHSSFLLLSMYSDSDMAAKAKVEIADAFLADPNSVSRSMARNALSSLAKTQGKPLLTRILAAYSSTTDANIKRALRAGMSFKDSQALTDALDFSLTDKVTPANVMGILYVASEAQEKQDTFYRWLDKNAAAVMSKMPEYHRIQMPRFIGVSCSQHNMELAARFFNKFVRAQEGLARNVKVAMTDSKQCLDLKIRFQAEFDEMLAL
ncbi:M1 family metallopeptidase [Arenicella sp. 4NH20-0111]|uniref:M1 family metallopeptidase n=1 Tax=Arenicella sp. 4NH20-0111 TaxID=3127648 RepID=UPI003103B12D